MLPLSSVLAALLLLLVQSVVSSPPCSTSLYLESPSLAGLNVQIDAWGDDSARVRIAPTDLIANPQPQALTPNSPPSSQCTSSTRVVRSLSEAHREQFGNLIVDVSPAGLVNVSRASPPALLLSTTALSFTPYPWQSSFYKPTYAHYHNVDWSYAQPAGYTYALGEHHHSREELPYTNFSIAFTFSETAPLKGDISIPWTIQSHGLGVLWNQPGWGTYTIANSTAVTWTADAAPQFDAFFTTTPAPSNVSAATTQPPYERLLRNLLVATNSFPRALPHYATGFWQCKLRYRSQAEVIEAARGYFNRSLPLSVIVIDAGNWAELGDFAFNPDCFPDPSGMVRELAAMGVAVMVSLWPHSGALSPRFAYMKEHGMLTHNSSGGFLNESIPWMPWPPGPQPEASAVDFLAPEAQKYVAELLATNFVDHGIKMFWLDADEPDCALPGQQWWNGRSDVELGSVYPLGVIQTVRDALDSRGMTDGMVLSRDTWVGGGPMGAAVWSGDIYSTFAELRRQVLVSQNVALSGIYHWTTDVAGFIGGSLGNSTFEELAVRWFQFGAFCPIFRTHGDRWPGLPDDPVCGSTGGHTEVWYFQHAALIEDTLRLRESLRPYVEHHLQLAATLGRPLLQPMFYAFPDVDCYAAQEQFMSGRKWLVAPVLEEGATQRRVYLPAVTADAVDRLRASHAALGGASIEAGDAVVWRHHYSQQEYEGGQWLTVKTALADFPLFQLIASSARRAASSAD